MNKQKRKAVIAGNWKMNNTPTEAGLLLEALIPGVQGADCEVVVCVPFTDLCNVVAKCAGTNVHVGAQNVHFEKSGAIVCVGESLTQREQGVTEELVRMQVKIALKDVTEEQVKNVIIAYEPIWAIGTGRTATSDQAQEVCAAIRKVVGELYGEAVAEGMTIQYGGSMNPGNAAELLAKPDVDGGLIGGASLHAGKFCEIVDAATKG